MTSPLSFRVDKLIWVDRDSSFNFEAYVGGNINCFFKINCKESFNDLRIWIQKHNESSVVIKRDYPYWYLAFENPNDVIKFIAAWGESILDIT